MEILQIDAKFRAPTHAYPVHHSGPNIEEAWGHFAFDNHQSIKTDWIYIPIYFWNYTVQDNQRNKRGDYYAQPDVQQVLDQLDPARKYFAVSQCDDGIYERLPENVTVLSAGGTGHIPIPLICSPHPLEVMPRDYKVSFVGKVETGGPQRGVSGRSSWDVNGAGATIRRLMFKALSGRGGWDLRDQTAKSPQSVAAFRQMLARSQFGLCPRGYGRTSFRLYECIQTGCLPIYLYDDEGPWLPFQDQFKWDDFCLLLHHSELAQLPAVVDKLLGQPTKLAVMRAIADDVWSHHLTFNRMCRAIVRMLEDPDFPNKFLAANNPVILTGHLQRWL